LTRAKAFVPGRISSLFQICDRTPSGAPIRDPARRGSRGGGPLLDKGVITEVEALRSRENEVRIYINDTEAPAETSLASVRQILRLTRKKYSITVRHTVELPIGAGFGTSGAGALGTAFATARALGIEMSSNQLGRVAHIAEVLCQTGLGTVGPQLFGGGLVLTLRGGAPGHNLLDRIVATPDLKVVAVSFAPIKKATVLGHPQLREQVNRYGEEAMRAILENPTVANLMRTSRDFGLKLPLSTRRVREAIQDAEEAGAIGAAQNMIGEAVHALVESKVVGKVVRAFEGHSPRDKVIVANLDFPGARLIL